MGWVVTLGILTALCWIPLGVSLFYEEEKPGIRIKVLGLRFSLPVKKKEKEEKKPEPKPQQPNPSAAQKARKPKRKLSDLKPFLRLGLDLLGSLRKKLRVEKLLCQVTLAGEDPCDLAVTCGALNAAAGTLLANLNDLLVIRKQDVQIRCDFEAPKTRCRARVDLTITLGRLLGLAVLYGLRAVKEFILLKNQKGGATL